MDALVNSPTQMANNQGQWVTAQLNLFTFLQVPENPAAKARCTWKASTCPRNSPTPQYKAGGLASPQVRIFSTYHQSHQRRFWCEFLGFLDATPLRRPASFSQRAKFRRMEARRMCANVRECAGNLRRKAQRQQPSQLWGSQSHAGPSWSRRLKTRRSHMFIEWSLCLFSKMGKVRTQRWWIVVELSELSNVQNTSDIPMN